MSYTTNVLKYAVVELVFSHDELTEIALFSGMDYDKFAMLIASKLSEIVDPDDIHIGYITDDKTLRIAVIFEDRKSGTSYNGLQEFIASVHKIADSTLENTLLESNTYDGLVN